MGGCRPLLLFPPRGPKQVNVARNRYRGGLNQVKPDPSAQLPIYVQISCLNRYRALPRETPDLGGRFSQRNNVWFSFCRRWSSLHAGDIMGQKAYHPIIGVAEVCVEQTAKVTPRGPV